MKKILSLLLFLSMLGFSYAQVEALMNSADRGDLTAQLFMGRNFKEGSTSKGIAKNLRKALHYYKLAAVEHDHAEAQYQVSELYFTMQNADSGFYWLERSAENGYAPAMDLMAYHLSKGYKGGNPSKMFKYYQLAASQNYLPAYYGLGECYRLGRGVRADLDQAHSCYQKLVDNGYRIGNVGLAITWLGKGDPRKSWECAQQAVNDNFTDAIFFLAWSARKGGHFKDAHSYYEKGIELFRRGDALEGESPLLAFLEADGLTYFQEGNPEKALERYAEITKEDSNFCQWRNSAFCDSVSFYVKELMDGLHFSVKSFSDLATDLDARSNYPMVDPQTGKKYAIVKIITNREGFNFDLGLFSIGKVDAHPELSEIWVYVPEGARKIKISHPQLGQMDSDSDDGFYWFPSAIRSASCYRLVLSIVNVR